MPCVASRYKKVAEAWGGDFGLAESDLAKLPTDLLKLEWLCILSLSELRDLLNEKKDWKKENRANVIKAVKAITNMPSKPRPKKNIDTMTRVEGLLTKVVDLLKSGDVVEEERAARIKTVVTSLFEHPLIQSKTRSSKRLCPQRNQRGRPEHCWCSALALNERRLYASACCDRRWYPPGDYTARFIDIEDTTHVEFGAACVSSSRSSKDHTAVVSYFDLRQPHPPSPTVRAG